MLSPCSGGQQSEVHVSVGTLLPAWAKSESPRRPAPHPLRVRWLPCLVFTPPLSVCVRLGPVLLPSRGHRPCGIETHLKDLILTCYIHNGPISKYGRILGYRGSGPQHVNLGGHSSTHNNEYLPTSSHMTPAFQWASGGTSSCPVLGSCHPQGAGACPAGLGNPSKTIMGCRSSVVVTLAPHPETRVCHRPQSPLPVNSSPLRCPANSLSGLRDKHRRSLPFRGFLRFEK